MKRPKPPVSPPPPPPKPATPPAVKSQDAQTGGSTPNSPKNSDIQPNDSTEDIPLPGMAEQNQATQADSALSHPPSGNDTAEKPPIPNSLPGRPPRSKKPTLPVKPHCKPPAPPKKITGVQNNAEGKVPVSISRSASSSPVGSRNASPVHHSPLRGGSSPMRSGMGTRSESPSSSQSPVRNCSSLSSEGPVEAKPSVTLATPCERSEPCGESSTAVNRSPVHSLAPDIARPSRSLSPKPKPPVRNKPKSLTPNPIKPSKIEDSNASSGGKPDEQSPVETGVVSPSRRLSPLAPSASFTTEDLDLMHSKFLITKTT